MDAVDPQRLALLRIHARHGVATLAGKLGPPWRNAMRNPWTTKNPFMSAWLSAANKVTGSARGQMAAATRRQTATMQAEMSKQIVDFWTGKSRTTPTQTTRSTKSTKSTKAARPRKRR